MKFLLFLEPLLRPECRASNLTLNLATCWFGHDHYVFEFFKELPLEIDGTQMSQYKDF